MKMWRRFAGLALALALTGAPAAIAQARETPPQSPAAAASSAAPDLAARLAAVERALEGKRQELGIPGVSFVIVRDDRVIFAKGFGHKDVERKLPVTPDTLFAIGSASKAFTAMLVAMAADEGKLSLDDSPKKFLPYFRMRDPEADARITVRDLLDHSSGLNRTDTAWVSGALNREEVIRVAGQAKPTAKLNEKFQYQNVMYSAAGEVAARALGSTWEGLVAARLFRPLGMKSSTLNAPDMQKSPDHALPYDVDEETKEARRLPMRDFPQVAAAGSINSNARDMAQWLRLMLGGGVYEGRRLLSEKNFAELVSPQTKIGPQISYGLGWFLRDWHGHKVVEHGGNIDGFNSLVAMMPDQRLGFVMLTNISNSTLGATAMEAVWSNLVGRPGGGRDVAGVAAVASDPSAKIEREVGSYLLAQADMTMDVSLKDGKLFLNVPGQANYPLESLGGRRYKLGGPAPAGFFVTFRPAAGAPDSTEVYLEQPQGNFVLKKVAAADARTAPASSASAEYKGPLGEVVGSYEAEKAGPPAVEVEVRDGKVVLVVPGQPPYPLVERGKDMLASPALPDAYSVGVRRDESGKVSGLLLRQPEGEFAFRRAAAKPSITVDELMAKVVEAAGGEAALRRHKTMVVTADVEMLNQGVSGEAVTYARAPNAYAAEVTLVALGKKIGKYHEFFDGRAGGDEATFLSLRPKTGKALEEARVAADFYAPLTWKTAFKSVEIRRMSKVGDDEVYVVVKTPEKGSPVTDYISAKTFLLVQQDTFSTGNGVSIPVKERLSDYRPVDGVMVAFTRVSNSVGSGETVTRIREVKFDAPVPETTFRAQNLAK